MKKLAIFLIVLFASFNVASAVEFQVGAYMGNLSAPKDNDYKSTSVVMPTVALSFESSKGTSLILEGGYLSYSVKMDGDRREKNLSEGEMDVTGTSLLIGIKKKYDNIYVKAGLGTVQYQFDYEHSSRIKQYLSQLGFSSAEEEVKSETGTQYALGAGFIASEDLELGFEYRQITVKPDVTTKAVYGSTSVSSTKEADFSHSMVALRMMYTF